MNLNEAAYLVHEEAKRFGEYLPMEACEEIAKRLLSPLPAVNTKPGPGEIARKYRERYEGDSWDNGND